jgi:uncharacterized protein
VADLGFLGWIALGAGLLCGLLLVPLGLGGNFVILGTALLLGLATGFTAIGWRSLAGLAALAIAGEVIEAGLGLFTVQRLGASKKAMLGTFLGGIVGGAAGTGVVPVVGSLLGAFAGAFAGAVIGEIIHRRKVAGSFRAGWAAFFGRVAAIAIKFEIGVIMVVIIVWRVLAA